MNSLMRHFNLFIVSITILLTEGKFNEEVKSRVTESLETFVDEIVHTNNLLVNFHQNGGFPNGLNALDRDAYLRFTRSAIESSDLGWIYVGMEDGMFLADDSNKVLYREPGNSGYNAVEGQVPPDKVKYMNTCVNKKGEAIQCIHQQGQSYIGCIDDCSLEPCPDPDSQKDCTALSVDEDKIECESNIKWCRQYTKDIATEELRLGYIPLTSYCANDKGEITQSDGEVRNGRDNSGGDCLYLDEETKVNRFIEGDYAFCGGEGEICNNTYSGGFESNNYDPRWRPWYEESKAAQRSRFTDVYPWYQEAVLGITYTTPIYAMEEEKNVFKGVLGIDIPMDKINRFLNEAYYNTSIIVLIHEIAEPHYIIGSSTNIKSTRRFIKNTAEPCPQGENEECEMKRQAMQSIADIEGYSINKVISRAFLKQKEENFPDEKLVIIKASEHSADSKAYLSQSQIFEQTDANLKWRLLIIMPMYTASGNAIMKGDSLFGLVIFVGVLGFLMCFTLFVLIYNRRKTRAIIYSDWKFTSAFIVGSATLNLSSLLLVGPNTSSLCMSRMFVFHWLFVAALSPLFAKTWRMYQLVGKNSMRRKAITNKQVIMYTMPFIVTQTLILLIFALVDPPQKTEIIEETRDGNYLQNLICQQQSKAFMIVELIFEGGLVSLGCYLAWKTRNLDKKFGETRQMVAAMYNIAFIGLVILLVSSFMGVEEVGKYILQAIGVLWGTVFSSAAFVVPRLLQSARDQENENNRIGTTHVSGLSEKKSSSRNDDSVRTEV